MFFSQSIRAQLARMTALLALSLVAVHNSPTLLELLAQQAMSSGCHQESDDTAMTDHSSHQ